MHPPICGCFISQKAVQKSGFVHKSGFIHESGGPQIEGYTVFLVSVQARMDKFELLEKRFLHFDESK